MIGLAVPLFMILLLGGVAIVFAMIFAAGILFWLEGSNRELLSLFGNYTKGLETILLTAIPFFMLAGEVMNQGGITNRIARFASTMVGHYRGGLAQVNVLSSILFAGMSGSAVADTSALGRMLIPEMEKEGYTTRFAAAITAASSVIGPIIPPSGIMIIYAYVIGGVSPETLFLAGIVPGLMVGIALMLLVRGLADRNDLPVSRPEASWSEARQRFRETFFPILTPIIIIGSIQSGLVTLTEASALAACYGLVVAFAMGSLTFKTLPSIFIRAAISSAVVLLLIGAAVAFKRPIVLAHIPELLAATMISLTENPLLLLLLLNLLLFFVGMFLDAGPAIIILGPILAPLFIQELGVDPVHFAIVMCVNLTVGLATPPMGLVLFVASAVSGEKVERISRAILPFLFAEIIVIILITYIPVLSLGIPWLFGYGG